MSTLKDLLVTVDEFSACAARLDLAVHLATRFGAHLTGLHVSSTALLPAFIQPEMTAELIEAQLSAQRETAAQAEALFRSRAEVPGITTEWRLREGDPAETAILHARYADLTIVGQVDPEGDALGSARELPERLLMGVGRPILVVPYAGTFKTVGSRVLVAWNASREATRAVNDALPLLEKAAKVTVLAINPRGGISGHGDVPGADIALHLSRHGVRAEAAWLNTEEVEVGAMLLSQASDTDADLIVMGGYGHSRMLEFALGGATREILRSMTVPVLMAH